MRIRRLVRAASTAVVAALTMGISASAISGTSSGAQIGGITGWGPGASATTEPVTFGLAGIAFIVIGLLRRKKIRRP